MHWEVFGLVLPDGAGGPARWRATLRGLAALEDDAILVWCGNWRWAQKACSGPRLDPLASVGFTSFPNHGTSGANRDSPGPGALGCKKLQGKESRD